MRKKFQRRFRILETLNYLFPFFLTCVICFQIIGIAIGISWGIYHCRPFSWHKFIQQFFVIGHRFTIKCHDLRFEPVRLNIQFIMLRDITRNSFHSLWQFYQSRFLAIFFYQLCFLFIRKIAGYLFKLLIQLFFINGKFGKPRFISYRNCRPVINSLLDGLIILIFMTDTF